MIDYQDPNEPIEGQFFNRLSSDRDPYLLTSLPASFFADIAFSGVSFDNTEGYRYDETYNYLSTLNAAMADANAPDAPATGLASALDGKLSADGGLSWAIENSQPNDQTGPSPFVWASGQKLFQITGLAPGSNIKATITGQQKPTSQKIINASADKTGTATIIYDDPANRLKTVSVAILNTQGKTSYSYALNVDGTGPKWTKITLRNTLGKVVTSPLGSYISGFQLYVPTAQEVSAATTAANWAEKFDGTMKSHFNAMERGEKSGLDLIKHFYATWFHGRKFLPALGDIVDNGNTYDQSTFWTAMDRLNSVVIVDSTTRLIANEAQFNSNPAIATIGNLTPSTAALSGFLTLHPEVRGHNPVVVLKKGQKGTYDYSFSTWVRRRIIGLFYSVTGRFAPTVKRALQVATENSNLNFMIDGKNDAYDPITKAVRGRELQVVSDECPALPFLDAARVAEYGTAAGRAIHDVNTVGIATRTGIATHTTIAHGNIIFATQNPDTIMRRSRGGGLRIAQLIESFFTIPGVIIDFTLFDGWHVNRETLRDFFNDGMVSFRRALALYAVNPTLRTNEMRLRAYFGNEGRFYREIMDEYAVNEETVRVLNANDAMRIINTALVGNNQIQGQRFRTDPWIQFATEEANNLRDYRNRVEALRRALNLPFRNFDAYTQENVIHLLNDTRADCIP